jgi:protein-S-isoprenylcysteine O-methyltransferase Ste14
LLYIQITVFCAATLGNVLFSRRMLFVPRCHGFYRFFVIESIIGLITLDIPVWYQARTPLDTFAGLLLYISIFYACSGFYLLHKVGKPRPIDKKSTDLPFENTSTLVRVGLYRFIRHPMYAALLFLAIGCFLKKITIITGILVGISAGFVLLSVKMEERENLERFGADYEQYRSETKMFIPFIW